MEFVYEHDEEVTRFVAMFGSLGGGNIGRCKTIGIINNDGTLIAGLVYFAYDPAAATMEFGAAAIDRRWLNRAAYRRMFEYPFVECDCQMLRAYIRADNEPVLSVVARMNFNLMLVPRHYGRSEDGVLCTLTDDQWLSSNVAKRLYRNVQKREAA